MNETCNNMVPHCQRWVIFRRNFSFMHPESKSCCICLDYLIKQHSQCNYLSLAPIILQIPLLDEGPERATVHEADLECIYPLTFRFSPKLTAYPILVDMKDLRLQLLFPARQRSFLFLATSIIKSRSLCRSAIHCIEPLSPLITDALFCFAF